MRVKYTRRTPLQIAWLTWNTNPRAERRGELTTRQKEEEGENE